MGMADKCQAKAKSRNNDRIYSHWENLGAGIGRRKENGRLGEVVERGKDETEYSVLAF